MSTWRSFRRGRLRRVRSIAIVSVLVVAGLMWVGAAQAVHDNGMFELDGNTVHTSATTPPYDWNSLFGATGNRLITPDPDNGPLLADVFVSDAATPDQSYFESDKDTYPIASGQQHWSCGPINNPLDKDDLLNAYGALVQVPAGAPDNAGHQVLYLGSERGSNNGTSFAGFWLLKDPTVGCSGSNDFSGHHTDGDILIVSNYTNGGGTQDVQVYRWTGDDASGSPVLQTSFNGSVCGGAGNDNACAIANSATITTPWSPTSHASNTFVETGIDLTNLLGASGGCFTTFLAETRSSDVISATLKDFAGGQFSTCVQPNISTTATPGGSLNPVGVSTQHDVATISKVGNRPDPTGTISFFLCNPSQVTSGGCVSGGTQVGSAVPINSGSATSANAGGSLTTAIGKYCWRAEYTPDTAGSNFYSAGSHTDATDECFTVVHGTPTISTQIAVTGDGSLGLTTLGDSAQLSGFVGSVTGETIMFNLYGPYAAGVTPTCTGTPAFTTSGTLNASGGATTSSTFQPTAAGTYVWVASYAGDSLNDGVTGKCSDAHESVDILAPELKVTKTADASPVSAGDDIGFTITVANVGAGTAKNVTLDDPLPAGSGTGVTWSIDSGPSGDATPTCGIAAGDLTCSAVDLGAAKSYTLHVTATTSFAECTGYDNTATASADNAPDASDEADIVCNKPELKVTKTADAATVNAGDPIGFTITVANNGPGLAKNVTLDDPLPAGSGAGLTWSIDSGPSGDATPTCGIAAGDLTCSAVDLGSGKSYTLHITATTSFAECTEYDNTATASASNAPDASDEADIVCNAPLLKVTKTADATTVNAGDDIGFTITVANNGPGLAKNVTLDDPLPAGSGTGLTWSIDSGPSGDATPICGIAAGDLTCSAVDLGSGKSYTLHVTATTSFAECTEYDNTATASASNAPDASDEADIVCNAPLLKVTKTADGSPVNAGDDIGFTITVANTGAGLAKNVTLDDPLPAGSGAGVTWSIDSGPSGDATPNCGIVAGDLTCSAVDLGAGKSYTLHVTATTSFAECTEYDNTATASATNAPDASDEADIVCNAPLLKVTKTADASPVNAGDDIGFTITVANNGPGLAKNVTLDDPLPAGSGAGVTWSIDSGPSGDATPNCGIAAGDLTCSAVDLGSGKSYTLHITATTSFAECTEYDNTATASATNAPDASDEADITCNTPAVSISKTADHSAPVNAGQQIGFTVEVKNTGAGDATGVTLSDPLPAGSGSGVTWAIDTSTGTPAQFVLSGAAGHQTLSLASGTLPAGADYKVHIVASTSQTECSVYDNTATLTTGNANNPNPASASESCAFHVDLSVTKAGSPATQTLGDGNITWTIVVTNNGPDTDTGVTIADPMPAGNTFVSATSTQGSCTGGAILNCNIGTMAAGASVTITLVTTPSTVGAQTNTATVSGSRPETNTANNSATATVQTVGVITPPVFCVAVSKVTPKQLFVGRKTKLTIHVTQDKKAVKGVHVRIKGPKINVRTHASNRKGVIKQTVKMKKAGILIFSPIASKRCNTKRVGVTNVFTPPVTG